MNTSTAHGGSVAHGVAVGLVSSKTSVNDRFSNHLNINISKPECALRRVKRLKRSVWASGHLHGVADRGSRPPVCWFVTLTYKGVHDWQPDHIKHAINRFRRFCKLAGVPCRYTWVAELQSRGAVHYHLLCWLPVGVRMPHWDRPTKHRAAFWEHGFTNTEIAKSGVGYLMKYLSKLGELTVFPKGLRLYGIGGLDAQARAVRAWYNLPEWVKRSYGVGEITRKACGFVIKETGELLAPMFSVTLVQGALILRALRELPERFHDGAYSMLRAA